MSTPMEGGAAIADVGNQLASQIVAEDAASRPGATDAPQGQDEKGQPSQPAASGESDATEQVEGEEDPASGEDVPAEDVQADPDEGKPKEDQPTKDAILRIGKQEFASVDDVIKEATRVIGHNANLAGELSIAKKAHSDAKATAEQLQAQLQQAYEINQQWVEYDRKIRAGEKAESPDKSQDVTEIVSKALSEQERLRNEQAAEASMRAELTQVQNLPNYSEVADVIYRISDKKNPMTDQYFTPLEAYNFACREKGVENLANKKEEAAPPATPATPAPPTVPKPAINKAAQAAAKRPGSTPAPRPRPAAPAPSLIDQSLAAGGISQF